MDICKICESFQEKLHLHVKNEHGISFENYITQYFGIQICLNCGTPTKYASRLRRFREFCSRSCTTSYRHHHPKKNKIRKEKRIEKDEKEKSLICLICKRKFSEKLFSHIWNIHQITREEYSVQFLGVEPKNCLECGSFTTWSRKYNKYKDFCNHSCRCSHFNKKQPWRKSVLIQGIKEKCEQDEDFRKSFYRNFKSYTSRYEYKGIKFRSKFEREIAKYLTKLDLVWQYEEIIFFSEDGSSIVTIPDFYISDVDLFLEAKSKTDKITSRVNSKIEFVKNQNCNIHLLIEKPHWKDEIDSLIEKRVL